MKYFEEKTMDDARKGEIALKLVERQVMKGQFSAPNDFLRDLGNVAKDINVDVEDLKKFYEDLLPKMIGKMFGRSSVSLKTSN